MNDRHDGVSRKHGQGRNDEGKNVQPRDHQARRKQTGDHRTGGHEAGNERYETARRLTEEAMDAMVRGDQQRAEALLEEARQTDVSAIEDVIRELDEDAGSDHSVPGEPD